VSALVSPMMTLLSGLGVTVMLISGAADTVTLACPVTPENAARTIAVPAAIPVARPGVAAAFESDRIGGVAGGPGHRARQVGRRAIRVGSERGERLRAVYDKDAWPVHRDGPERRSRDGDRVRATDCAYRGCDGSLARGHGRDPASVGSRGDHGEDTDIARRPSRLLGHIACAVVVVGASCGEGMLGRPCWMVGCEGVIWMLTSFFVPLTVICEDVPMIVPTVAVAVNEPAATP